MSIVDRKEGDGWGYHAEATARMLSEHLSSICKQQCGVGASALSELTSRCELCKLAEAIQAQGEVLEKQAIGGFHMSIERGWQYREHFAFLGLGIAASKQEF